jgi:hypothetical protein
MEPVISVEGVSGKATKEDLVNAKGTTYSSTEQSDGKIER